MNVSRHKIKKSDGMLIFTGIITICAIEYLGIGNYIPGAQRIPFFLSLIVLFIALIKNNLNEIFKYWQTKALIVLIVHTGLTVIYAIVRTYAFDRLIVLVGYFILFTIIYFVIKSPMQIIIFISSFVIYHCFLILVNLDKLSSTVRQGAFKAGYFLGNGNDFAWSLCIFMPLAIFLVTITQNKLIKALIILVLCLFVAGIIGTASRGAFLAVLASLGYLVLNSRKKILAISIGAIVLAFVAVLAPSSYFERMETIGAPQDDNSALRRITAWKASINMAIEHPFGVGAGNFNSAYGRFYRPSEADQILSYGSRAWISPHSIYFLVLGEYGFIGLSNILIILFLNFRDNQVQVAASIRRLQTIGNSNKLGHLPKYLNASLVAFSVGGIFLGGFNYPHIFILTAMIIKTRIINEFRLKNK
jgi:probable O-glycosylation ligase (exosortase A-associated)